MNKKQVLEVLYLISMIFAFTTRYGDYDLGYKHQIIIGLLWVIGVWLSVITKTNAFYKKADYLWGIKTYVAPHIIIHLYTIIMLLTGKMQTTQITSNLTVYVPSLLAISSIYLFQDRAFRLNSMAVILSWGLSVSLSFLFKGPGIFLHAIIQAYIDHYTQIMGIKKNYLEIHDIVLSIGYLFVFYIFTQNKLTRNNLKICAIALIIMILGMKKIAVVGIALSLFYYVSIRKMSEKKQKKMTSIIGFAGIVLCFMFILILSKGDYLFNWAASHGINVAGRNYYYKAILKYAFFSPKYLGIGRNAVTRLFNSKLSYMRVGGAHSDILKMYVENGFIMFGFWLWWYLIHIVNRYRKRYGMKAAIVYFGIIIYAFSLYLTDNTEIYYVCQILQIVIPFSYAVKEIRIEKNHVKYGKLDQSVWVNDRRMQVDYRLLYKN